MKPTVMLMINKIRKKLSAYIIKIVSTDIAIVSLSYYLSYLLRFDGLIPEDYLSFFYNSLPMVILVKIYFIADFRLYKGYRRYTSIYEIISLFKATVISSMGILLVIWISDLAGKLPRTVLLIDWCMSFLMLGAVRIIPRILVEGLEEPFWRYFYYIFKYGSLRSDQEDSGVKNVLIFGASDAGQMIVREMQTNQRLDYNPIGFIDDDPIKKGKIIHGIEILGNRNNLKDIVENKDIDEIIISISSARGKDLKEIISLCEKTGRKTKIIPSISEIVDDKIKVSHIRNIKIEDLLGREPINLNIESISEYIRNKIILITGAGGSIGSELCRQIIKYDPKLLVLFGRGEYSIFNIYNELHANYPDRFFPQVIGDVINKVKVEKIFEAYQPYIVFHAGADKHVPLMEMNPDEAVLNNIIGTQNIIEVSEQFNVERLICISTDKAVNPTNVMGACKRMAEKLIQSRISSNTKVIGVRFGNVLGSRGSVIPLFEKQIKEGGPVTVTHKDMTRFFMTIPEAAQLVIQAGAMGRNGDLFVLDMGEQVKIEEFARTMIRLAGFKPDEEIEITYTGIRPGEKIYEELICPWENIERTDHPKIIRIIGNQKEDVNSLMKKIKELKQLGIDMKYDQIMEKLVDVLPEYKTYTSQCKLQSFKAPD
jgi:FlaA1/EpsC-like NDP-sugar epimerase